VRVPFFHDHPSFYERPSLTELQDGPLRGRSVLVVVAPTECDAHDVRALWQHLYPLGVRVALTQETHGEARGEDDLPLFPNCLLVEVAPEGWDAIIFAGGRGAERVAEDPLARAVAQRFAAAGKIVAALGAGRRVLAAAHLDGPARDDAPSLAALLIARWSPPYGTSQGARSDKPSGQGPNPEALLI
jgi:putative intracellular protease/amidase